MDRWRLVNARTADEARRLTFGEKLDRIASLMAAAELFDMSRRDADDQATREVWVRLKTRTPGRG